MDATTDILQGKWHELKGQARQTFAKLTDDRGKGIAEIEAMSVYRTGKSVGRVETGGGGRDRFGVLGGEGE